MHDANKKPLIRLKKKLQEKGQSFWRRNISYKFWQIFSNLFYRQVLFLDTNMVIRDLSQRNTHPNFSRLDWKNYFVTDVISEEINDLEKKGLTRIFPNNYRLVEFSELRESNPDTCPIYYNLIHWMYNPANIASPEFPIHMIQSIKLRNRKLTRGQDTFYMKMMDRVNKGAQSTHNLAGDVKSILAKNMDISLQQYLRKKIKNRDSKSLLNDYKNVSLILLYTLLKKRNTVLITADRDLYAIVLTLAESLAQHSTFHLMILPNLSDQEKRDALSGKPVTKFLSFNEFKKNHESLLWHFINPYWRNKHQSFRVRLWDEKTKNYVEDLVLNLEYSEKELILNAHGGMACPFAKNDTHGNWLHYQYWPPPPKSPDVVKIIVRAKKLIRDKNTFVPDAVHRVSCRYAIDDKAGNLKGYYGFRL